MKANNSNLFPFLLLILAGLLLSSCDTTPYRQFYFINSGDEALDIVFEQGEEYVIDKTILPHSTSAAPVDTGAYTLLIFDQGDNLVRTIEDYQVKEDNDQARKYLYLDLEGNAKYATIDLSELYIESGQLTVSIDKSTNFEEIKFIQKDIESRLPFELDPGYHLPYDILPKTKGNLSVERTIVPVVKPYVFDSSLKVLVIEYLKGLKIK